MKFTIKAEKICKLTVIVCGLLLYERPTVAQTVPIHANDVSILFPLPDNDLSRSLSIAHLKGSDGARLLSDTLFSRFLSVSESADSEIIDKTGAATRISFPPATRNVQDWFVAGIRVDLGAPGLSADVMDKFGQIPQVRLVLQPVIRNAGGGLAIHDRAAHLIFSFAKGLAEKKESCPATVARRIDPDLDTFHAVLADFVALRDDLAAGKLGKPVDTSGPLRVHPGLTKADGKLVRDRLKEILEKHLNAGQLAALAVMGLPANKPDPWIFVPMLRVPGKEDLVAVPNPALDGKAKAQLLKFIGTERVLPAPVSDNQNETMTICFRPHNERRGVSTTELFSASATAERTVQVTEVVADPAKSHFFNTDCISCHTETRLLLRKVPDAVIEGVDQSVLPETAWNVRNFGWGFEFTHMKPTITRRTATETDEVVRAINLMPPFSEEK